MILFYAELAVPELKDQLYLYNTSAIKEHKHTVYLIELSVYKLKQEMRMPTKSLQCSMTVASG